MESILLARYFYPRLFKTTHSSNVEKKTKSGKLMSDKKRPSQILREKYLAKQKAKLQNDAREKIKADPLFDKWASQLSSDSRKLSFTPDNCTELFCILKDANISYDVAKSYVPAAIRKFIPNYDEDNLKFNDAYLGEIEDSTIPDWHQTIIKAVKSSFELFYSPDEKTSIEDELTNVENTDKLNEDIEILKLSEYMECPFCAEPIRQRAKICRFCNRDVS